ncbi:MAG: thiamine diphosphokinase [Candidatus Ozemobacteraceae bacterium]
MRILVVANGPGSPRKAPQGAWGSIIGVDGGGDLLHSWNMPAHRLVGDLDSISPEGIRFHEAHGAHIERHPADKNQTDLELALDGLPKASDVEIHLTGCFGGRSDMSLLNFLLLGRFVDRGWYTFATAEGVGGVLGSGEISVSRLPPGTPCALLAISDTVEKIVSTGVHWPLRGESLRLGEGRGVSNLSEEPEWRVRIDRGALLWLVTGPTRVSVGIEWHP